MDKKIKFDNEMKALAQGVYKGKEKFIPKDWIKVTEKNNKKTGYHAEAFFIVNKFDRPFIEVIY